MWRKDAGLSLSSGMNINLRGHLCFFAKNRLYKVNLLLRTLSSGCVCSCQGSEGRIFGMNFCSTQLPRWINDNLNFEEQS